MTLNAKKGSKFNSFIFGSGSKFRKDDYYISLNKENSFAKINSAAILKKDEHHEVKLQCFIAEPNCKSHQKIKNILLDEKQGYFSRKSFSVKSCSKNRRISTKQRINIR